MNLFETVKNNVSLREAAQAYGLEVNRHGKALCPFHNDRHPMWRFAVVISGRINNLPAFLILERAPHASQKGDKKLSEI